MDVTCLSLAAPEAVMTKTFSLANGDQVNTFRPRQNCCHFADDIFKCIFLKENVRLSIKISPKFVPKFWINNIPALVQMMAWRRRGDKPLSGQMIISLLTHICVTRPQWVNAMMTGFSMLCRSVYNISAGLNTVQPPYDMIHHSTISRKLWYVNSVAPVRCETNFTSIVVKLISLIDILKTFCEIGHRWMSQNHVDNKSRKVPAMAWCHQGTSHYLSQCLPRFISPYGRPQWFNYTCRIQLTLRTDKRNSISCPQYQVQTMVCFVWEFCRKMIML